MGPHIAFLRNQAVNFSTTVLESGYKTTIDNNIEFGLTGGVGYSYVFPKGEISLEARFTQGLTSLYAPRAVNTSTSTQNQTVSVCLGYSFNFLGKKVKKIETTESKEIE